MRDEKATLEVSDFLQYCTVTLEAYDTWYYDLKFQMLIDTDGDFFEKYTPAYFDNMDYYNEFEVTLPEGATSDPYGPAQIEGASVTVEIPAGTYDYYIVQPNDWAGNYDLFENGEYNRYDNFQFRGGFHYTFTVRDEKATLAIEELPAPAAVELSTIAINLRSSVAIGEHGMLYTWGDNTNGILGIGENGGEFGEKQFVMNRVVRICASTSNMVAIRNDATLWAWGSNTNGQLGERFTGECCTTPIKLMNDVVDAVCGAGYIIALKSDGTVWAIGDNSQGQLGTGDLEPLTEFTQICDDAAMLATSVTAAVSTTAIVKHDGTLLMCGNNFYRMIPTVDLADVEQIGDLQVFPVTTLTEVMPDVRTATVGVFVAYAITNDDTLYGWGSESYTQLGVGDPDGEIDPVTGINMPLGITELAQGVKSVAVGWATAMYLTNEGELYTAGEAGTGMGFTTNDDWCTYWVKAASDVVDMAIGDWHSMVMDSDGFIWTAGYNTYGQLGYYESGSAMLSCYYPYCVMLGTLPDGFCAEELPNPQDYTLDDALNIEGGGYLFVNDAINPYETALHTDFFNRDRVAVVSTNSEAGSTSSVSVDAGYIEKGLSFTFDMSISGGTVRLYVNGSMVGQAEGIAQGYSKVRYDIPASNNYSFTIEYTCPESNEEGFKKLWIDNVQVGAVYAESITLNPAEIEMRVGSVFELRPLLNPAGSQDTFEFESSDENVVIADPNGALVAIGEGAATITMTSAQTGLTACANVTVYPAATGEMCYITLNVPTDIFGDGSGYQMLLDADALAFEERYIIPYTPFTTNGDADPALYEQFEYKLPYDADGATDTDNIILLSSYTIAVPAGMYDFVIVTPQAGVKIWCAGQENGSLGAYDNFNFEADCHYTFTVTRMGSGDYVLLDINMLADGEEPPIVSTPELAGDVNMDNEVTMEDALITLRHALSLVELSGASLSLADMNGDGEVATDDALAILRIAMALVQGDAIAMEFYVSSQLRFGIISEDYCRRLG